MNHRRVLHKIQILVIEKNSCSERSMCILEEICAYVAADPQQYQLWDTAFVKGLSSAVAAASSRVSATGLIGALSQDELLDAMQVTDQQWCC
jgi:hypothetical protein